ncbi:MAG: histidinol-phosphatase [Caldilineaceae bacterium SB0662_bin_9]|uniref:Histidinol-phosphatase n=1 Tax=Caldilineaceae bacterium SB0662_bin_9 TaxID=2605258 RepID=A0A6B1DN18_9CHLR|nr:histidinol-phosphatase [Caldilineaceae bacterium SB0662_bin_9]
MILQGAAAIPPRRNQITRPGKSTISSTKPIFYESHMHTTLCRHATGSVDDYARQAVKRGLKGITVTCHCPLPNKIDHRNRMAPDELDTYVDLVFRAAAKWRSRLDIRMGMESDFAPFLIPYLTELHEAHSFSYILGSVHPQAEYFRERYATGDTPAYRRTYYRMLAVAAETGLFDCLSHPDLVKYIDRAEWNFDFFAPVIEESLDRIAAAETCMELNTAGHLMSLREYSPGSAQLKMMHQRRIPVVVGADAHVAGRVGDHFKEALDLLANIGYRTVSIFLDRERRDLDIEQVRWTLH